MATAHLVQVLLWLVEPVARPGGVTQRTCWVDRDVRAGDTITLKGDGENPDAWWEVRDVYRTGTPPERGWHVGGM